jgi:HSP20 family protein
MTQNNTAIEKAETNSIDMNCCNPTSQSRSGWTYQPDVDVVEREDAYVFHADLPGATPEQIDVTLEGSTLTIHGAVARRAPQNARLLHQGYGVGDYHRRFDLGDLAAEIASDNIEAGHVDGVLTVTLRKQPKAMPRKIKVNPA